MAHVTTIAPVPPEGSSDKPVISDAIAALMSIMLSNAKSYDQAALALEMTAANVPFATSKVQEYRQAAASDIGAIAALLRNHMPHASFKQRCDYLQMHLGFSSDDVNRVWNAFLAGY